MSDLIKMPLTAIAILALTACAASKAPAAAPASDTSDVAMDASKPADSPPSGQSQRITILGYECGDNCYLDYSLTAPAKGEGPASQSRSALCTVDACYPWFDLQEMPPEFIGRGATVTIGIGEQHDNEGNVMSDDFPLILSIAVDPAK
jgi:hypothetical protein